MGLNISIINNSFEALRYIQPKTDAEVVLYDLLKESEVVLEEKEEEKQDLNYSIDELKDENKALKFFFNEIVKAYNKKLGVNRHYDYNDAQFLDEIVVLIEENLK